MVNAYTVDNQITPAVAMDTAGGFVVAWERADPDLGISGRRFDGVGNPLGDEFQAHTFPGGSQSNPSIARNPAGSFLVVWGSYLQDGHGDGVFGQRFDAAGMAHGEEFQIATRTLNPQSYPDVAMASDGSFVVVWESYLQDGNRWEIFGQRFDSVATPQGMEFQINVFTAEEQRKPRVSLKPAKSFVVVWNSEQDGDATGVFARRFDSSGSAVGGEFQINGSTTEDQRRPSVVHTPNGDFVVTWESDHARQSGYDVFARAFNALAQPRGWEVAVNSHAVGSHTVPRIAGAGGDFVVPWQGGDGDGSGVLGRRFNLPLTLDVDGDGEVKPLTDVLLILRYSFGFRGATLINGAFDPDCTRCDATTIGSFLSVM